MDQEAAGQKPEFSAPTLRHVFAMWWPLAASWLMMAMELIVVSAAVARLEDPQIHLAAYGGVVFPLSMVVEAPIIMLLAASTALSRDWDSYARLRRFMGWSAAGLTLIHLLIAVTPLFGVIVGGIMHAPEPIRGPARVGLIIMTPWTASIAYRRFQQGVLIRHDRSRLVGVGTALRLSTNVACLTAGYLVGSVPGIVVATVAVASGVVAEAVFAGLCVRPVLRDRLRHVELRGEPLTLRRLLRFYTPLALSPLLALLGLPVVSAGLGRMPHAIESLATWPVVNGLVFAFRSVGLAYNEVVVAQLDRPGASRNLFRFTVLLSVCTSVIFLMLAATPLGWMWFSGVSGLAPALAHLGTQSLWLALLLPALGAFQSWYQGIMVNAHRTTAISEAVALSLLAILAIMVWGARYATFPGLFVGVVAVTAGSLAQTAWLTYRSRSALQKVRARDAAL